MPLNILSRDAAEHLETMEDIVACLDAALADGELVSAAIGAAALAHGRSELVRETGLSRDSLYRSLSMDGNLIWARCFAC